jgi:lipopolysaccharide/colanic/teichoic acid biosynthesis glycosyltransferase
MQARIEFDLEYLRRWTLLFDLKIIIKTVSIVLKKKMRIDACASRGNGMKKMH